MIRESYISFMCRYIDCSNLPKPGTVVLSGEQLWSHPHVRLVWRWFLELYEPSDKPIALVLPCTPKKPYSATPLRRVVYANLKKHNMDRFVQVYTASDPMGLVPREIEDLYPFANYDHPPKLLKNPSIREKFVELLSRELPKLAKHRVIVVFASKTYVEVLRESVARCALDSKTIFIRYSRKAFRDGVELIEKLKRIAGEHIW